VIGALDAGNGVVYLIDAVLLPAPSAAASEPPLIELIVGRLQLQRTKRAAATKHGSG
jgi:hypothetical protein